MKKNYCEQVISYTNKNNNTILLNSNFEREDLTLKR